MIRALLLVLVLSVRAADDPSSGKYHLARGEELAKQGRAYEAAQEAQQAYWLDPSLKAQADALLAQVHGGKGIDREFGDRSPDSPLKLTILALAALGVAYLLSRFVRLTRP